MPCKKREKRLKGGNLKKLILVLLCLMVATSALARTKPPSKSGEAVYQLGLDKYLMGIPTGVTADTVVVTSTARALGKATYIYSVLVAVPASNADEVYVGDSSVATTAGFLVTVTGNLVRLEVDNLSDVYAVGTQGDIIYFIAETR